jgi:hypothetical protein
MDPSTEQQMSNLQITVNERPKIKIKSSKWEIPLDKLSLLLIPQLDLDKAIEFQTLVHKYNVCYPKPVALSFLFSSLMC